MAMRSFLVGAVKRIARAGVRAAESVTHPKAPAMGSPWSSGLTVRTAVPPPSLCKSPVVGTTFGRSCLLSMIGLVDVQPAASPLLPKLPAVGYLSTGGYNGISLAPNAAATGKVTSSCLHAGVVGSSSSQVASIAGKATTFCIPTAPIGMSCSTRPNALRGLSTVAKIPAAAGKPGGGPLRYFLVVSAVGGAIAGVLICLSDSEPVEIGHDGPFPDSVDWSLAPAFPIWVNPCYNCKCGSCWAVAAVKSIQYANYIKRGVDGMDLSVQQVIDCAAIEGCSGSNLVKAYRYIRGAGLTTEDAYPGPPYEGRSLWYGLVCGYCKMKDQPVVVRIEGHQRIHPNEESLMRALQSSPIAVYANVNDFFSGYREGVIEYEECPPRSVKAGYRHCLLLVGYGTDTDGKKYWKLLNTWGPSFGEAGYVRLRRGVDHPHGVAGITEHPGFTPVLKTEL